jgi:hypothetical protein
MLRMTDPTSTTMRGPNLSLSFPAGKVMSPNTRAQMAKARAISALVQPNSALKGLMKTLQA